MDSPETFSVGFPEHYEGSVASFIPDPLLVFGRDDQCLLWLNAAAELWLGRSLKTLSGQAICGFVNGLEQVLEASQKTDHSNVIKGDGLELRPKGRRTQMCSYRLFPCTEGTALMIVLGGGVTAQKPRNIAVNMFGQMLAHELKNPLAGIRGAAQILQSGLSDPDDRKLSKLIIDEVDRLGRLSEKIEKTSAALPQNFKHFNVHSVLRRVRRLIDNQELEGIKITESFDPSLPDVFGDEDALVQAVLNLVQNAVDAITGYGCSGKITLRTSYRAGVMKRNRDGQSYALPICVTISDNGPGLDALVRDRIFEPFITTKTNGHGLGLSLVADIINDLGGLINVDSSAENTDFSLMLPVSSYLSISRQVYEK